MSVLYTCNHCGNTIGQLDQQVVDTRTLGINELSTEERKEMVEYLTNGDIKIKTICEDCQESLENNPHYHELDYFIQ